MWALQIINLTNCENVCYSLLLIILILPHMCEVIDETIERNWAIAVFFLFQLVIWTLFKVLLAHVVCSLNFDFHF